MMERPPGISDTESRLIEMDSVPYYVQLGWFMSLTIPLVS